MDGERVLLCHSKGAANTFLPGGHVDFCETARHALEREVAEELGLGGTAGRFLGVVEHAFPQKGVVHCEVNLVFALAVAGIETTGAPRSSEEKIDFRWVPMAGLRDENLEPSVLCDLIPAWQADEQAGRWVTSGGLWKSVGA